ncbi:MAG: DUF5937 family protein [Gemmatimonadaceae bacterium]|nr:DUF5937 family protein [Gemmatimonadaceae bacterium]
MADASPESLVQIIITPRFEVFYALQVLESGAGERLLGWRREMDRRISARLRTSLASVAPSPLIWPLLADSLRDEHPAITFPEMIEALRTMDTGSFQRSVLGGVFKMPGSVDGLVSGRVTLSRTVALESKTQERLLSLLGLHPFSKRGGSAVAFGRIVAEPAAYRGDVITVMEEFWKAGFADTWKILEHQMRESARVMKEAIERGGFAAFTSERRLPITMDNGAIIAGRSGTRIPMSAVVAIHVIPSAFNTAALWAAYTDSDKRTRFFIPVADPDLSPDARARANPALVFSALGDTTRYAIASTIACTPMTSVELARVFGVSKPTISHHVQLLRAAGLLNESQGENGVVLSLNRRVLETASSAAASEMFDADELRQVIRRTRRANKS